MKETVDQSDDIGEGPVSISVEPASSEAVSKSPLWLSHHREEDSERCIHVSGHQICRRCTVLYPTVVATTAIALSVGPAHTAGLPIAVVVTLLLVPFITDWVVEHLGSHKYSPARQVVVTIPAGIAGGLALAIHAHSPFDPWVTMPILLCVATAVASALHANRSVARARSVSVEWEKQFEAEETRRDERLRDLLRQ